MEERNVIIRNVAVADLRRAGEDKLSSIRRIENCALLVTAEDADMSQVEKRNVAMSITLPRDTIFRQINGQGSISASDGDEGNVYLMVNGHLNVESDVTPDMITRRFAGMMINGSVNCPRSVGAAMESIGARINGSMSTYPDGAVLLISIHEGRNRQVRKMCAQAGLKVTKLLRISEGPLALGELAPGKWRELTEDELALIYET